MGKIMLANQRYFYLILHAGLFVVHPTLQPAIRAEEYLYAALEPGVFDPSTQHEVLPGVPERGYDLGEVVLRAGFFKCADKTGFRHILSELLNVVIHLAPGQTPLD